MDLEAELDRLYQGPAGTFVAERNKLAQALRRSGNPSAAEEVARLPRPSPVAWVVNQLRFRAQAQLEALRDAGLALRRAQESASDSDEFTSRKRAHQEALRAATDRASTLAEEASMTTNANLKRRIEMTLNLLSAVLEEVNPPPGRMCAELEPLGFDALTGVVPAMPKARPERAPTPEDAARALKLAAVKTALDAADREVRRLELESERSQENHDRAIREAEDAERRAETTRRTRDDAARAAEEARTRLDAARHELEAARRELEDPSA